MDRLGGNLGAQRRVVVVDHAELGLQRRDVRPDLGELPHQGAVVILEIVDELEEPLFVVLGLLEPLTRLPEGPRGHLQRGNLLLERLVGGLAWLRKKGWGERGRRTCL